MNLGQILGSTNRYYTTHAFSITNKIENQQDDNNVCTWMTK